MTARPELSNVVGSIPTRDDIVEGPSNNCYLYVRDRWPATQVLFRKSRYAFKKEIRNFSHNTIRYGYNFKIDTIK